MTLYADSSAVVSWLFGEDDADRVGECLQSASFVVASMLTLTECDRVLHRAAHLNRFAPEKISELRGRLRHAIASWSILHLSDKIFDRARQPFPEEPIRTLDALHLATALDVVEFVPDTAMLTLDKRVRRCARALGLSILPPEGPVS